MAIYNFSLNDPFDRTRPVRLAVPLKKNSSDFMQEIRSFVVPADGVAIWFFGQNGFVVKDPSGLLIGIDLYLSNSCAALFQHLPYRLDRQLPIFVEPEDLDIDVFLTTHSHDDHADPETIRRFSKACRGKRSPRFVGPWQSFLKYLDCGVPENSCVLIHPAETLELSPSVSLTSTFSLPTDSTDLNHSGVLIRLANGITFYNTGDTAYAEILGSLLPRNVDICSVCINGGFHNLHPREAAKIVRCVAPRIVIPCHYDMMVNNVGSIPQFLVALDAEAVKSACHVMDYYDPWIYRSIDK